MLKFLVLFEHNQYIVDLQHKPCIIQKLVLNQYLHLKDLYPFKYRKNAISRKYIVAFDIVL